MSSALIHVLASISWMASTTEAATKPTTESVFSKVLSVSSSSSSSIWKVAAWEADGKDVPSGWVGACSWTVAFGKVGNPPAVGWPGGLSALVGAPARRIVGAGAVGAPAGRSGIVGAGVGAPGVLVGGPAERSGIVGAGAVGRGGPAIGAVAIGGALGVGGRTGGAAGTVAEGTAGGASAAFKVTRTVSFFKGTLEVNREGDGGGPSFSPMRVGFKVTRTVSFFKGTLEVSWDGESGWFSFSLIRAGVLIPNDGSKTTRFLRVKHPARKFYIFLVCVEGGHGA